MKDGTGGARRTKAEYEILTERIHFGDLCLDGGVFIKMYPV